MFICVITDHKSAVSTSIASNKPIVVSVSNKTILIVSVISAVMTTTLITMCCSFKIIVNVVYYLLCSFCSYHYCWGLLLCTLLRY